MHRTLHPLHAVLLASTVPLFLGVLLSDIAYFVSYEVQWKNFASWLIVGGLAFAAFALVWGFVELSRSGQREVWTALYVFVLLVLWVLGFINGLVHAGDAWASMPVGLVLSAIIAVLAVTATGLRFARPREVANARARGLA